MKNRQQEFHALHKNSMHSEVIPCIPQQLHAFYNVTFIGPSMLLLLLLTRFNTCAELMSMVATNLHRPANKKKRHTLLRSSVVVPLVSSTEHRKPSLGKVPWTQRLCEVIQFFSYKKLGFLCLKIMFFILNFKNPWFLCLKTYGFYV